MIITDSTTAPTTRGVRVKVRAVLAVNVRTCGATYRPNGLNR